MIVNSGQLKTKFNALKTVMIFPDISALYEGALVMNLENILSMAGKPGLYRYISQARNGIVVESLADGKRIVASVSERISRLSEIYMFTSSEDKPLPEILKLLKEKFGDQLPVTPKSDQKALIDFFSQVLPDFDRERVYPSDIKKLVTWYLILKDLPEETKPESQAKDAENSAT
jgi:hypothetical protein